jgi:hypothetical protein
MQQYLNEDLANISGWTKQWLISFSPEKSETITFSKRKDASANYPIILNGKQIKEVECHKHLGFWFSRDLSWSKHFDSTIADCAPRLSLMKALNFTLDRKSLQTIYTAFIRPKLEYGDVVFAGAPVNQLNKLDKIEIEAIKIITGAIARTPTAAIYKEYGQKLLGERRFAHVLSYFYKIHYGFAPEYLVDILLKYTNVRNYGTRDKSTYRLPFSRSTAFLNSFFPRTIRLWNNLDLEIQNSLSLPTFKNSISPITKEQKILYYGERWSNVHHARMRMGCSKLNSHLHFNIHVIPTPRCLCGHINETPEHFFFNCPITTPMRNTLLNNLRLLGPLYINDLLYGYADKPVNDNIQLFKCVHKFIKDSKRLVP